MRRVVVTGLGVVTSLGIGWPDFWRNILAGKSGIDKVTSFDTKDFGRCYGSQVREYLLNKYTYSGRINLMGKSSQMAITAAKLALEDAGCHKISDIENWGLLIGTTMGESGLLEKIHDSENPNFNHDLNIDLLFNYPANSIIANLAKEFNLKGQNILFTTACAAGNYALGYAYDLIKMNRADSILVGGVDSFSRVAFSGFARLAAMAEKKCQPFDLNRQGMLVGEGAGILLVEELSVAMNNDRNIYAEILGYGLSCDVNNMVTPGFSSVYKTMSDAIKFSRLTPERIDYISAHGTGTIENDKVECDVYKRIFGHLNKSIPMSSIKSMLGHTMGAASAIESIVCCLALKDQVVPPTINYETPDPDCAIDCVPNIKRKKMIKYILNNSQAFGGNSACVVLGKFQG